MSIRDHIAALVSGKKLFPHGSSNALRPSGRRLFMTDHAWKEYRSDTSAVNLMIGRGYIKAACDRWVMKRLIFGDKGGGRFLKPLEPPPEDIWEIRVTDPTPQARLFVMFPEPDTLIMSGVNTRSFLGKRGSQNWSDAMALSKASWQDLFPNLLPFRGNHIHQYVTENCDDYPI